MALPEHTRQPAPNSEKSSGKKKKFESNNKYFSICTYVVATFTICLIIFKFINNWRDMQIYTSSILSTIVTIFDCISDCLLYQPVGKQD